MLKWVLISAAVLLVMLYVSYVLGYGQSLRTFSIFTGEFDLRLAYINYVATGTIQPNGTSKPYVFTNTISVRGVGYPCVVAIDISHGFGEGTLT